MEVNSQLENLRRYVAKEDFKGYDPYDGLNSPLARALSFGTKYGRIAFIQGIKRFPVNLRPLLGVRKEHNPKGIGLFLWGYTKLYKADGNPEHLPVINHLLDLLDQLKSRGYAGNCWGYNFDWQNRAFYIPKGTPTIVNSSFIGHALIDTWVNTGNKRALDMALSIKDFILNDLDRLEEEGTICFSYTPIDQTAVHNANLLGASLLIRLYRHNGDEQARDTALASLAYTMKHQHDDGSWYYAETSFQSWIDSFHTGFNLQAIRWFLEEGFAKEYRAAFDKGVTFYADNFFLTDGTPKYYHDRVYPIDIHAPAQALAFFSRMGIGYQALTDRVLSWMLTNLYDPQSGTFAFQKTLHYTNRIPYMRWGQAWAFHGLTEYYLYQKTRDADR